MAFYSSFALVPTLFLALAIVAAVFGREATAGLVIVATALLALLDAPLKKNWGEAAPDSAGEPT